MNIKNIILCADDYGLNASVSQGIIELLKRKHLSAVSCLTTGPEWRNQAGLLKTFHNQVDIGLHFNLTEGRPLSKAFLQHYGEGFFPHPSLILRSFGRKLKVDVLAKECEAQLQEFIEALGFLPDFIDGHQHVHQLPQVRSALLRVYANYWQDKKAYIRTIHHQPSVPGFLNKIKQIIIYLCGSPGLQQALRRAGIASNSAFAGVYSFANAASSYRSVFSSFLEKIPNGGLIMCHPGLEDASDQIFAARIQEYTYLMSEQFVQDCEHYGVRLVRGEFGENKKDSARLGV